eukprot:TRINITY_DN7803_c0_g1_i1.p1 TRINITY_DN7803_c0_g1~~TRINITY_DN7803_c0_g1_i1.p1  ORF type:complete len:467 (+),score=112.05 TRINITY_DN7803_c0_g1_i1:165-1403(+)
MNDNVHEIFSKISIIAIMIAVSYFVLQIITKLIIAHIQKSDFWPLLSDYIYKEKVFDKIVQTRKRSWLCCIDAFRGSSSLGLKAKSKNPTESSDDSATASFEKAVEISKKIFDALDTDQGGFISLEEMVPIFGGEEPARKAFKIFDKDENGQVSFEEMIITVIEIYKDRETLFVTLYDRANVADILANMLRFFYWLVIILVSISIFDREIIKQALLPLGTAVLALAFVFGNSLRTIWEAILLIFVVKPFDVGDRVTLEGYPTLKVHRMNLFTTEFYATDGRQFIVPNSTLMTQSITQYKRSRNFCASFQIQVSQNTMNQEKFQQLRNGLLNWLKNDSAKWQWNKFQCYISDFEESHTMKIEIWAELKGVNWNDPKQFREPRTRMFFAIQELCKEYGITYTSLPQYLYNKKMD